MSVDYFFIFRKAKIKMGSIHDLLVLGDDSKAVHNMYHVSIYLHNDTIRGYIAIMVTISRPVT